MRIVLYPYKIGSASCRALQSKLTEHVDTLRVFPDKAYTSKKGDIVVNWGTSSPPTWKVPANMLNSLKAVKYATNKIRTFDKLLQSNSEFFGPRIPEHTTSPTLVRAWLDHGCAVVVRHALEGHSGKGIEMLLPEGDGDIPNAPLYTKYSKKAREFRVHVFKGRATLIQEKKLPRGVDKEQTNYAVRTHATGWIFATKNLEKIDKSVSVLAIEAVAALGLDFGSVDVLWNNHYSRASLLEVNTACGLEGITLDTYTQEILKYVNSSK